TDGTGGESDAESSSDSSSEPRAASDTAPSPVEEVSRVGGFEVRRLPTRSDRRRQRQAVLLAVEGADVHGDDSHAGDGVDDGEPGGRDVVGHDNDDDDDEDELV